MNNEESTFIPGNVETVEQVVKRVGEFVGPHQQALDAALTKFWKTLADADMEILQFEVRHQTRQFDKGSPLQHHIVTNLTVGDRKSGMSLVSQPQIVTENPLQGKPS